MVMGSRALTYGDASTAIADSRSLGHFVRWGLLKQRSVLLITRLIGCRNSVIQRQCVAKHESERGNHGQAQEAIKSTQKKSRDGTQQGTQGCEANCGESQA